MQWLHLLAKLSPERVQPILREGQCKPPDGYNDVPNMPSDHHDSPPERFEADDHDERSSIGDSSLLAPPMSHRQPHNYLGPQHDPHQLQSLLDGITTSHDPPFALATNLNPESAGTALSSIHGIAHSDYPDGVTLPNPHPLPPHLSRMHRQATLTIVPPPQQQPLVYRDDGYAPAGNLPPQNYISPTRAVPSPSAPHNRPGTRGAPLFFLQAQDVTPPALRIQTAVVPPNSELARSPRFTFAPPGAYVPADPITTAAAPSPTSVRSWRDKGRARFDRAPQQPTQEGSVGRARSHSWTVVSSVFRRRSGRRLPGPAPLTAEVPPPPQLTASGWRDLAHWAYRPTDHIWGESFASHVDIASPIDFEASSNLYDRPLPPLPPHLSHLPAPSAPLMRTDSSTSALNPFLVHRPTGVPPLSWDLCTSAHSILFPTSRPGPGTGGGAPPPAVPMAPSDYAQPATWPPCGALRIGAIGGRASVWPWPVDVRNPVGVRCGDVFRALVANLHQFVRAEELADMLPEHVTLAAAACATRLRAGLLPGSSNGAAAASMEGIRRVDCLLGHTQFYGLVPGPSPGEWTMCVGVP